MPGEHWFNTMTTPYVGRDGGGYDDDDDDDTGASCCCSDDSGDGSGDGSRWISAEGSVGTMLLSSVSVTPTPSPKTELICPGSFRNWDICLAAFYAVDTCVASCTLNAMSLIKLYVPDA